MSNSTLLTRVRIKSYKSIAVCDVKLGPLTFLVGQNGAGKSNFLDALRLVTDALRTTLDHALRDRGGINEVRRRSGGHPNNFAIRLDFSLKTGEAGYYSFKVGARPQGGFEVLEEECQVSPTELLAPNHYFRVIKGTVESSLSITPAAAVDRLYLVSVSGLKEFAPVYQALSSMGFYNLNPASLRDLQPPDAGEILARDGGNIASVIAQLHQENPTIKKRVEEYLEKIVPGLRGVDPKAIGHMETVQFRQGVAGSKHPWSFLAANMSDGTLRALGILVALFQSGRDSNQGSGTPPVPLVGLEEPEVALHPAAAGIILNALREASHYTQILVTSHSPDLLDNFDIDSGSILSVVSREGITQIGSLDDAGRSSLRDHLYTAGELLRMNQLAPDPVAMAQISHKQLKLFGDRPTRSHVSTDATDMHAEGSQQ